jgi:hypothetical protein
MNIVVYVQEWEQEQEQEQEQVDKGGAAQGRMKL